MRNLELINDLMFHIEAARNMLQFTDDSIEHQYSLPLEHQDVMQLNNLLEQQQRLMQSLTQLYHSLYIEVREQIVDCEVLDESA